MLLTAPSRHPAPSHGTSWTVVGPALLALLPAGAGAQDDPGATAPAAAPLKVHLHLGAFEGDTASARALAP